MEQHPVPQNVTTFQFRLIGDMTLKQFGYLCGGAILAFIAYRLPLPFLFTWPLAFGFAFLGVGFAFIPIEERPMDVWVFSFFKSIYNPTQYVWTKTPPKPQPHRDTPVARPVVPHKAPPPTSASPLAGLFQSNAKPLPRPAATPEPKPIAVSVKRAQSPFAWLSDLWSPTPHQPSHQPQPQQQQPTPHPVAPSVPLKKPVTGIKPATPVPDAQPKTPAPKPGEMFAAQQKIAELESSLKELQQQLAEKNVASNRIIELQKQLTTELQQKATVEDELVSLKRHLEPKMETPDSQPQQVTNGPTVKVINTQDAAVKVGLPRLTNIANVIAGLVKDGSGNLLPGILVTVTDHEGVPVRALKTNKLGQFAASTPLGPGTYFVEIEDPRQRFTFSRVQITLNGAVVPALEIMAKSQKQLTREMLTQEIFGKNSI